MKTLGINAFKSISMYGEGVVHYDMLSSNLTLVTGCSDIEHLVESVKGCINCFSDQEVSKDDVFSVTIDFKPTHDIEKGPFSGYKIYFPLTKKEKNEFWKHFKKEKK